MSHEFKVGQVIHGFAGGYFGRDSYGCRRIEAVGHDWIVTRKITPGSGWGTAVEMVSGSEDLAGVAREGDDRGFCEDEERCDP